MDQKSNDRFDFRELFDTPKEPLEGSSNSMENILQIIISPFLDTREPNHSGMIVRVLDRFMFSGESVSFK